MTNSQIQQLLETEYKLWEPIFGFRAIDYDYVQLWVARDLPIVKLLSPFLFELPSKSGYVWLPENDAQVVPALVQYRDNSIRMLEAQAKAG